MRALIIVVVGSLSLLACKTRPETSAVMNLSTVPHNEYPPRTAYQIKAVQPDFWPNKDELTGNAVGGVAMNLVWTNWEGAPKSAPCAENQQEYDGRCFTVQGDVDDAIRDWTQRGVRVTAVVYGVPAWAREGKRCVAQPGFDIFCAPSNAADYARFAGMVSQRYNGENGHGRIFDFVIHNEVNSNTWFNVWCGQGQRCDKNTWVNTYADNYIAAYDRIVAAQPQARVLISLDHHFGEKFENLKTDWPMLSAISIIKGVADRAGDRAWRIAYHPYPPELPAPQFSPDDYPKVTYGSIGALAGWLRKNYPNRPSAWEIQTTESGVNSIPPQSSEKAQADGVCRSFYNLLATPGITNYVYHRMSDHPDEIKQGAALGLRHPDGTAKAAWAVWAMANRSDLQPPQLSCGFENLPYTKLTRYSIPGRGHWTSSRLPPANAKTEQSWRLFRDETAGTHMLYECLVGKHNMLSKGVDCEGQTPLGPVGYAYDEAKPDTVPLYRCRLSDGSSHFVSTDAKCEGQVTEHLLGYALK